jgi:hypothetical protein
MEMPMKLIGPKLRQSGVAGSGRVMASDGSLVSVRLWTNRCAPAFDSTTKRISWAPVSAQFAGLRICISTGHPLLTPHGYVSASSLKIGDDVATAKRLPTWEPSSTMDATRSYFLALLLGDGGLTHGVSFTKTDHELVDAARRGAALFGASFHPRKNEPITYDIVGIKGKRGSNPVLNWLRELGVAGKKSVEKFVPQAVLATPPDTVLAFLAGMLDTDGTASARTHRVISWSTGSERLGRELQHVLMRVGVRGVVSRKRTNFNTIGWTVSVYSAEQHRLVCDYLSPYMHLSRKRVLLLTLADGERLEKRNVDTIPRTDALHALILSEKTRSGAGWPQYHEGHEGRYNEAKLFRRSGRISRHVLRWLADWFDSEPLRREAATEIQWDRVTEVEQVGTRRCYMFTAPNDDGDANFVCEGFVVGQSVPE